jgi:hypothetical protein
MDPFQKALERTPKCAREERKNFRFREPNYLKCDRLRFNCRKSRDIWDRWLHVFGQKLNDIWDLCKGYTLG